MAKLLGHRQTKETDNRQAQPTTTAPLLDSTRFVSSPLDALPVNGRIVLRTNDERIKELKKLIKRD